MYQNKKVINEGVCYAFCFLPLSLYVYGWFVKNIQYDVIEIYAGQKKIGIAEKNIERCNILLHYGNTTDNTNGWRFYADNYDFQKPIKYIKVVAKKNGIQQAEIFAEVKGISIEESLHSLVTSVNGEKKNILVIPGASNKIPMLNKIAKNMNNYNFIALVEAVPEDNIISNEELKQNIEEQYGICNVQSNLHIYCMPLLFTRNKFLAKKHVLLDKKSEKILEENEYLRDLANTIREKFPNIECSYALYYVSSFHEYVEELILSLDVQGLILWNQFFVLHNIVNKICKKRNVPVVYTESGVLPGTLAFETLGQMGESMPAVHVNEFEKLNVSKEDMEQAEHILEYLYNSRLNRWTQYRVYKKEQLIEVKNRIISGRPIIFYAGQNDFESGIKPYTEDTKEFHSPIFKSSYEAALYLAEICEKNNWNFIYKRHPMMRREKRNEKLPENVINFDELDIHDIIDFSDVTVTILSQTAYVALIRKKPVVMLGYNQLRGKECTYEAFEIEKIEEQITNAIIGGRTETQVHNFNRHVARLTKYYLFRDFNTNADFYYGKDEEELITYLNQVLEK